MAAEFSLNTQMHLLSKKSLWLSDGSMGFGQDGDVAFAEGIASQAGGPRRAARLLRSFSGLGPCLRGNTVPPGAVLGIYLGFCHRGGLGMCPWVILFLETESLFSLPQ